MKHPKKNQLLTRNEATAYLNHLRLEVDMPPIKSVENFVQRGTLKVAEKKSVGNFFRARDVLALHQSHLVLIAERGTHLGRPRKIQVETRETR